MPPKANVEMEVASLSDPTLVETISLSSAEIQDMAEKKHEKTTYWSSKCFQLGLVIFVIGIILYFLLNKVYRRTVSYIFMAVGVVIMLIACFIWVIYAPDRYCARNPIDPECLKRYTK
jgi:cell division protein FtsW (lipid II flippase)